MPEPVERPQQKFQSFLVMPEDWRPGQAVRIPDPSDPTGKRIIEVNPADVEVVAEVPAPPEPVKVAAPDARP